jgi:hypothetical protein
VADRGLYRRWIVANGWAEGAGLGTTFVIGMAAAPAFERMSGTAAVLGAAMLAVLLGTLLEGAVVGIAQERVLRDPLAGFPRWTWTVATSVGAGLAWCLGMVPSTIAALGAGASAAPAAEPPALLRYGLAIVLGLVAGPMLGVAQWTVLRRVAPCAGRWLWANALAWAVGMVVIFAGMDLVPWTAHPVAVAGVIYVVCAAAGVAVGAIHGRVLVSLLAQPSRALAGSA